jgi:hemoglobin
MLARQLALSATRLTAAFLAAAVVWPASGWAQEKSLYDRLGGLAPISVVVSDFIDALVQDATLNANPAIDAARKRVPPPYLKFHVTALVCQVSSGPCTYQGRSMKDSHAYLNITEREWERMVTIFKEVLAKHRVPAREQQELVDIVGTTKGDIVVAQRMR